MTRSPLPHLVRRALARHAFADTPDAELLARFTTSRDPEAFTELVERYAPLVWSACRRVLTDASRAEDAFQATFVTFACKAGTLRRPDQVAGWLYGVARRTAWRHRVAPQASAAVPDRASADPSPLEQVTGKELVGAIEAEVERLPEKYRTTVLLYWFEDCPLDEAAKRLGVTRGVVWGRLRYAREQLRRRLARRGFGLPAVIGTGLFGTVPVSARLVERVVATALRAPAEVVTAGLWAHGPAVKPVGLAALATVVVLGLALMGPAGGPDAPAKDAPKPDAKPGIVESEIDDGIPLPAGALHRFGNRQARHPDGISGSTVSPDGKYLVTLGNSSAIVWDVKTMVAKCVIRNQDLESVYVGGGARATFLPDSKHLLLSVLPVYRRVKTESQAVIDVAHVFDVETGTQKLAVKGEVDHLTSAWLAADGKEIAAYSQQAVVYHDANTGKELRKVACGPDLRGILAIAPQANLVAFRGRDNDTLRVVDVTTGKEHSEWTLEKVNRAAITPDGRRMAAVDGHGKIHVYDMKQRTEQFSFDQPAGLGVVAMQFSADQQTLYFGGQHGRLYRWDLKAQKKLPDVGQHCPWNLTGLILSPDEPVLYSTAYDRIVRRWDLKTLKELPAPEGYMTQTAVIPMPDRTSLLVADHSGRLDRWDLASGKHLQQLQPPKSGGIDCVAVSADGRWFAGGQTGQNVVLRDLRAGTVERIIPLADAAKRAGSDHVKRVAFRPDGKVLLTTSALTGVTAWEVPTGKKLWNVPGIGPWLAVDPKGRWVAVGGGYESDQVRWTILDQSTGELVRRVDVTLGDPVQQDNLTYHNPPYVSDLRFTPDGSRVVTAHYDETVRVWDPAVGQEVGRWKGTGQEAGLTVSADGRWVGVGQGNRKIAIWELATGKPMLELIGHDSGVRDVEFTRDGRGIVGNADLAPILWDLCPRDTAKVDEGAWEALAGDDGPKAYKVQWALIKDPPAAVKLLNEKVKPIELSFERAKFDKWVADLDSPQFRAREAAERELTKAGMRVPLGWVRRALADATADESRSRLARVLTQREKPNPEEWRLGRAVQVLELSATPEAIALLKAWAAVDGSPVTDSSREALARLAKR
jgi:RNA polymerase sigma factor (sigma-70 family)